MKKFDMEKFAKECKTRVSSANLTIRDLRTGETQEVMFYRPGEVFPIDAVRRELAVYGYDIDVYALPDPPEVTIDWKVVYEKMNEHHKDCSFNPQAIIAGAGAK